jgi:flavin-dependent dehydrogenase
MSALAPVAVIGAGPAGSTLARLLARGGATVLLIDERGPHEKLCGGGVTLRGYRRHPVLSGTVEGCVEVREVEVESGEAQVAAVLPQPLRIYPREWLNRVLFDAAIDSGARFVRARARSLERTGGGYRIELDGEPALEASFVAGADGAAGICRKVLGGGTGRDRFLLAAGYHAERRPGDQAAYLGFTRGLKGYLWIFPRPDHLSIGICSGDPHAQARPLADHLEESLATAGRLVPPIQGTRYSFPIPDFRAFDGPRSGPGWALVGDAGGFVDPITLEGISYAMRSAEVLAGAILQGRPERFEELWRQDFGKELARAARLVERFYAGDFPERMVRSAARFPRVRRALGALICGEAAYRGLGRRVAGAILADRAGEMVRRFARRRQAASKPPEARGLGSRER